MTVSNYAIVAQVRLRELRGRLALAAFIGLVGWIFAPSIWPIAWFIAVVATQALDWLVCRPLRTHPEVMPSLGRQIVCCAATALSVIVYSAIGAYVWFDGGVTGKVFAMILSAGGLLHVSLHMHHSKPLLISAVIPHATYFLGLPLLSSLLEGNPSGLLVAVGCLLYMTHLVVTVRQSSLTTKVLQNANQIAGEERRKAEIASAAKSDFLAVISHEIRTPMNAVISAANLLRRTRLDREQREHVSMLLDAGDVLLGLLNDVLDFSKIEAGKMDLEAKPLNVRDKLGALGRLWQSRAASSGVRLKVTISDDMPVWVSTDALRLQQILFNLISNAVKFTADGEIVVRAEWRASSSEMIISVRDTGVGIAPERLDYIFNSFEQADAGITRRYGGTGLGLAISRRLAELMGGTLTATSQPEVGSTFTLTMPVEMIEGAHPVETGGTFSQQDVLKGANLLVADDHAVNRRILALFLEPHGCRLTLVENGLEAFEAALTQPFDAILMDMQMPVMDGLEASRRLRASGVNRKTPLIALTANAMDIHRAAWKEVGADAFLTKPIDPALLARTVAELVEDAKYTKQSAFASPDGVDPTGLMQQKAVAQ